MAILKFGPLVTGARGTIAGCIFSANKASPYCRAWSRPAASYTTKQTGQRATWSELAQAWAGLTSGQRAAWDTYAADAAQELTNSLGETYYASGFNWYVKINSQLATVGRASTATAPTGTRPTAISGSIFNAKTGSGTDTNITTTGSPFNPNYDGIIRIAPAKSEGLLLQTTGYKVCDTDQNPSQPIWYFQSEIEALYGSIIADSVWFAHLHRQDTEGQISPAEVLTSVASA